MRDWPMSPKCAEFLSGYWDEEDIEKIVRNDSDLIKWIREMVNPWLRERRREGKSFPIVQITRKEGDIFLKLSTEK